MPSPALSACSSCPLSVAQRAGCPFTQTDAAPGQLLFSQGEACDRICFVRDGLVTLSVVSADGAERRFNLRGARTLVGMEAVRGAPSPCEVRALTRARICVTSPGHFQAWLGPDKTPARAVLGFLLEELSRRQDDQDWREGASDSRVARLALACADVQGGAFPIHQKQQMARLLGMRPETFSRSLRRLEDLGLLDAKRMQVRDAAGLKRMAS